MVRDLALSRSLEQWPQVPWGSSDIMDVRCTGLIWTILLWWISTSQICHLASTWAEDLGRSESENCLGPETWIDLGAMLV